MKGVQVPEGLKTRLWELQEELGDVVFFVDPCYGACDIRDCEAKRLGLESLIHYGHSPMVSSDLPVEYRELPQDLDLDAVVDSIISLDLWDFSLCSTVQYVRYLPEIARRTGGKLGMGRRTKYPGQVLGCDVRACPGPSVFIGDGLFHPLGIYLHTRKPVYQVLPDGSAREVTEEGEKVLRERYRLISWASQGDKFAVVLSTKKGQINLPAFKKARVLLKEKGRKVLSLASDYFLPSYVQGIDVDAFVFTGCPRVAIEDWHQFKKPVLTPLELEIALGIRDDYEFYQF